MIVDFLFGYDGIDGPGTEKENRQRREYGIPFTALPLSILGQEILLSYFVWNTYPKSKTPCV